MSDFKFSVSICVYGGDNAAHFDTAMDSIFNQTLPPDEVVLVVDGPVGENISAVIKKYEARGNLKVVALEQNEGHGNARRRGMAECSHELVALMDADDISVNTRFEKQIGIFKNHHDLSVVGGLIKEFTGERENIVGTRQVPMLDSDIKEYMKRRCPMNQVTVMFKKSDVKSAGGYIDWFCEEDYYLWLRLALNNKSFYNIQENLVYVRVGKEMYQRRGGVKYFMSEARLQGFMLKNKIIGISRYIINVMQRLILQVLMPNSLRGWVFKKFARKTGGQIMEKKYTVGYTTGVFDLFHVGHLNILKKAKERCDYLIVGVSTDELVEEYKNKTPVIPFEERKAIVEAIKYVDRVVPQENRDKIAAFNKYKFDIIFVGDDWKGSSVFGDVDEYMKKHGAMGVFYIPYTEDISSTILRTAITESKEGK